MSQTSSDASNYTVANVVYRRSSPLYEPKIKKLESSPELKSKAQDPEIKPAAVQAQPNKPEAPASFIEIISKRIDKLLEKTPPKSSAA